MITIKRYSELSKYELDWLTSKAYEVQREVEPHLSTSVDRISNFIKSSTENSSLYSAVVFSEDGDKKIGFFLGILNSAVFANDMIALDLLVYTDPEYREGDTKILPVMLTDFEEWAIERGATATILVKATRKGNYESEHYGYTAKERHAIKMLRT